MLFSHSNRNPGHKAFRPISFSLVAYLTVPSSLCILSQLFFFTPLLFPFMFSVFSILPRPFKVSLLYSSHMFLRIFSDLCLYLPTALYTHLPVRSWSLHMRLNIYYLSFWDWLTTSPSFFSCCYERISDKININKEE